MDQTQRHKDCFYRTRAKAERMEQEALKWKAVVEVAEGLLEKAAAEILALKAEVERMKAGHQEEVDRLVRERNALLVGTVVGHFRPNDQLVEAILDSPDSRLAAITGVFEAVRFAGYEKYLDLPSDLGKSS